jgi:hypothetical protein
MSVYFEFRIADRKKGEPRNVTRCNTNVNSVTLSPLPLHFSSFVFLFFHFFIFFSETRSDPGDGKGFKQWQLRVRIVYNIVLEVAKGRIIWQPTLELQRGGLARV